MSAKAVASLNNNVAAQPKASSGAGPAGSVETATASPIASKATATTPVTVMSSAVHLGTGTTPPATAAGFDRTVVTSLGK